jgi:hypothetical protein
MLWQNLKLQAALFSLFVTSIFISACQYPQSTVSVDNLTPVTDRIEEPNKDDTETISLRSSGFSCANPPLRDKELCAQYEQQILDSVVRLEVRGPSLENPKILAGGGGHGTIKDGRYIVVHNHFMVDLSIFSDREYSEVASLNLYSANGNLLLRDARPPLFEVVVADQETLVLDFGTNERSEGFFEWYRIPSAPFKSRHETTIGPGTEVAQVNWDGKRTFISWVEVAEVITNDGVPRLVLANPINDGSSGDGVFWNGTHIANNWMAVGHIDDGGNETYQYSIAALNSPAVVPSQQSKN